MRQSSADAITVIKYKFWKFGHFIILKYLTKQNTLSGKSTSNKKRKNKKIAVDKQNVHVKLF